MRHTRLIAFLILSLLGAAAPDTVRGQPLLQEGDEAPPFSLETLDGHEFSLSDVTGPGAKDPKTVLMVLFATYSQASRQQLPTLRVIHERWHSRGVEVVLVGTREAPETLKKFFSASPVAMRVLPDRFGRVSMRYGAAFLPHLVIISRDGVILFQQQGEVENLGQVLQDELAAATLTTPGAASEASAAPEDMTLVFSRAPASTSTANDWRPLTDFAAKLLPSIDVTVEPSSEFDRFDAALRAGDFDLVSVGALQYIEVADTYEPLVKVVRRNQEYYYGIIFVADSSGIKKLEQLEGAVIAFANQSSTSGYLLPTFKLAQAGLVPSAYDAVFAGSHEQVAKMVAQGQAAAGACFEDCRALVFPNALQREKATTILTFTERIPGDPILVRKSLPEAVKMALREAFLAANRRPEILEAISEHETTITGFAPARDEDYAVIRDAQARLAANTGQHKKVPVKKELPGSKPE